MCVCVSEVGGACGWEGKGMGLGGVNGRTCPFRSSRFSISASWRRGGGSCCRGSVVLRRLGRRA